MSSSLTNLELRDVTLRGFNSMPELFRCMASLSQLQRLELTSVRVDPAATGVTTTRVGSCFGAFTLADALRHLTQLTLLSLDDLTECQLGWKHIPGPMGAAIAGLQQLQELDLHSLNVPEAEPHTLFKQLPVSITRLTVGRAHVTFTPFQTPGLLRLTALRDLLFTRVLGVEPSVLSGCASSLTRLTVRLAWTDSSLSALAHMLPQLQQLQSLCLTNELYGDDAAAEVAAPQVPADDCALLLSPAKLTSLTLREVGLAPGGAQRMFAAGGGALRELCIAGRDPDQQYSPPLTRSDLGRLALTWPQLQQLQLVRAVAEAPAAAAAGQQLADQGVPSSYSNEFNAGHLALAVPAVHAG
uniref:Uncharacterized protein n=1 Tax=Tetradesmus obliquus TaxID=3088 RepID=A0A383VM48_TETOB|eukprot:jgi/Sobl393_1/12810/SZX66251.1